MRKLILVVVFFATVLGFASLSLSTAKAEGNNNVIKVNLNGSNLKFDADPYIKDGRTLVPFRKLFESFGVTDIYWDDNDKSIYARNKSVDVFLKIGQPSALVNGYEIKLDVAPEITDGRTFVPLRFVSENLGADVKWDEPTKTIYLSYSSREYKQGQIGTYNDLKFSIDKVYSENGALKVSGKINNPNKNLVVVVSDEYGSFISSNFNIFDKVGDMYQMEANAYMPTCHQFEAKFFIIKILENDKLINIGEYDA